VAIQRLEAETDEMWSFVGKKANKQWLWLAMDAKTRQVMAFHISDRSRESGAQLWAKIPEVYQQQATFYTDLYEVYKGVIPPPQHKAVTKQARKTNHVERFNNTLRQRISRTELPAERMGQIDGHAARVVGRWIERRAIGERF
jgi:insertion element IS1 protein InsB